MHVLVWKKITYNNIVKEYSKIVLDSKDVSSAKNLIPDSMTENLTISITIIIPVFSFPQIQQQSIGTSLNQSRKLLQRMHSLSLYVLIVRHHRYVDFEVVQLNIISKCYGSNDRRSNYSQLKERIISRMCIYNIIQNERERKERERERGRE